jgi:hypothetical protein
LSESTPGQEIKKTFVMAIIAMGFDPVAIHAAFLRARQLFSVQRRAGLFPAMLSARFWYHPASQ